MSTLHPLALFGLDEDALLARRSSAPGPFGDAPGPIEPALLLTAVAIAPTPSSERATAPVAVVSRPPVRPLPDRALAPVLRVAPRGGARLDHVVAAALIAVLLAVVVASGLAVRPEATVAAPVGMRLATIEDAPSTVAQLAASASRAQAAEQLLRNPALIASDDATPLLASGRVDARLILILGQSLATAPTRVADFPAGDDDATGVRHRMLVGTYQGFPLTRNQSSTPTPEAVAAATAWMAQLTGVFEPTAIELTDAGLLITLDDDEPEGLLPAFSAAARARS
ncbi:hypothetical protein HQQ80_13355 [Microbacteriaceae bacterium VKM Ac-2855]|nr:hypothetical protein [Microbacteriaceae bacterium VKM Ac-2855]